MNWAFVAWKSLGFPCVRKDDLGTFFQELSHKPEVRSSMDLGRWCWSLPGVGLSMCSLIPLHSTKVPSCPKPTPPPEQPWDQDHGKGKWPQETRGSLRAGKKKKRQGKEALGPPSLVYAQCTQKAALYKLFNEPRPLLLSWPSALSPPSSTRSALDQGSDRACLESILGLTCMGRGSRVRRSCSSLSQVPSRMLWAGQRALNSGAGASFHHD